MTSIEAVYQGGIFRPLGEVQLPENQRVHLQIQTIDERGAAAWLEEAQRLQRRIIAERGCFPDSATGIAADRARDE